MKNLTTLEANFPTDPAEVFTSIKDALGVTFFTRTFAYSKTHIYRWCASKNTNEETRKNPLHILEIIIGELMNRGYKNIAIATVDRLARIVGGELSFRNAVPDKDSFLAETLDVNLATARFHAMANDYLSSGTYSVEEIRAAKKNAHLQIDEAYKAFEQEIES